MSEKKERKEMGVTPGSPAAPSIVWVLPDPVK